MKEHPTGGSATVILSSTMDGPSCTYGKKTVVTLCLLVIICLRNCSNISTSDDDKLKIYDKITHLQQAISSCGNFLSISMMLYKKLDLKKDKRRFACLHDLKDSKLLSNEGRVSNSINCKSILRVRKMEWS